MVEKVEQLLQEYDLNHSFKGLEKVCQSPTYKVTQFYSQEESICIKEYIKNFQTTLFLTQREVCEVVQSFIYVSKYNLKRNLLKKKDGLTFVCSCISKKPAKKPQKVQEGIKAYPLKNCYEIVDSYEDDHIGCRISLFRSKRHNSDACKYRLRFKYDKERRGYLYFNQSNLIHNHRPESCGNFKEFKYIFRNIKFPIGLVLYAFNSMISALCNNCTVTKEYIKLLKRQCDNDYHILSEEKKEHKADISKKLTYFLNQTKTRLEHIIRDNGQSQSKDNLLFLLLGLFLKKTAGSYVELQDMQELQELLESQE